MTSILVTIANFLQWAELKQSHHSAMIAYGKLSRDIRTTLSLIRDDRPNAGFYLQQCKHTLDRLTEDSPTIPDDIAKSFKKKYKGKNDFEKPDVCNGLKEVEIESEHSQMNELVDFVQKINEKSNIMKTIADKKVLEKIKNNELPINSDLVKKLSDTLENSEQVSDIENNLITDSSEDELEITNFSKGVVDEVLKNVKENKL